MLKKHMAACLVATAFIAAPALAQTSGSGSSSSASSGQFLNHMNADQWRASKLVGVNIYGANNEKIGDVNEVLIDRKGNADAVVIGVGGFLGMGEKDVAIPFSAIEWKYDRNDLSTASTNRPASTGTTATNPPAAGSPTATNNMATGGTTGSTAAGPTAAGSANRAAGASSNMDRGYPDHGVVRMTKDQLQNAPTFRYSMNDNNNNNANRGTASGGAGTGSGTMSTGGAGGPGGAAGTGTNAPKQ
jgi:sporulation protein YlmC with PRC-barrel domain